MSLHPYLYEHEGASSLRVLAAYENGSVSLWQYEKHFLEPSNDGMGWQLLWNKKAHLEAGGPSEPSKRHMLIDGFQ